MTTLEPAYRRYDNEARGLTRLRMGDEIFGRRDDAPVDEAQAGFIVIRRGGMDQMPRPAGPVRPAGRSAL